MDMANSGLCEVVTIVIAIIGSLCS